MGNCISSQIRQPENFPICTVEVDNLTFQSIFISFNTPYIFSRETYLSCEKLLKKLGFNEIKSGYCKRFALIPAGCIHNRTKIGHHILYANQAKNTATIVYVVDDRIYTLEKINVDNGDALTAHEECSIIIVSKVPIKTRQTSE